MGSNTVFRPRRLAVLCALFAAGAARAGNDGELTGMPLGSFVDATSLEALANVVVTDTKVAQSLNSVTQKIAVLRQEDLERQPEGNRNLAEFMRYTSGQFVNVLSRNDANWGSYGGLGPKYNTYLLDGLPMDSFADAMSLDSSMVERIEIHKGPASVLYSNYLSMDFAGNEAPLAGTTNFVLKSRVETPLTRFSAGAGSWGTWQGKAYTQGRNGGFNYMLGLSSEQSNYTQYGQQGSWLQTVDSPDYRKTRLFANVMYELGRADHTVSLFLNQTRHDGDMGRPNRDFDHQYDTANFTYNNRLAEHWQLQLKAGERRYDRGSDNDGYTSTGSLASAGYGRTRQQIGLMDMSLSYLHGDGSVLTVGTDRQRVTYRTTNRNTAGVETTENSVSGHSTGYFLQEKFHLGNWILRAGLRHNHVSHDYALLGGIVPTSTSASWSKNLWSLGARYNISPALGIYANAGSSFMVPAAKQIGGTITASSGKDGQLPNPSLLPESGVGRDIGMDWQASRALSLGLRGFYNTVSSAIVDNAVTDPTNPKASQAQSVNAGKASSVGLELDVRYAPAESLSWFANLTRTRSKVESPLIADQDGANIPFVPDTVLNGGLAAKLPGNLTLAPYFHWVGRYYDSAAHSSRQGFGHYGVLNLRVQHAWRPGMELTLDVNNLFNRRYDMPWGFQDTGRSLFARINFRL